MTPSAVGVQLWDAYGGVHLAVVLVVLLVLGVNGPTKPYMCFNIRIRIPLPFDRMFDARGSHASV